MKFELLSVSNLELYVKYLEQSLIEEPEMMLVEKVDLESLKNRLCDPFYQSKKSILAIKDNEVIGRIEYHFYGCLQDGFRMAYVDWVYVLPQFRKKGIGQSLFDEFEKDCRKNKVDQYYLIRATNPNANSFYQNFKDANLDNAPILRKDLSEK